MRELYRRKKYPYRCHNKLPDGRRCWTRKAILGNVETTPLRYVPKCPGRGSRRHWRIDNHRRAKIDRRKQTCWSSRCPYHYPHSQYSPHCVNRPGGPVDWYEWKYGTKEDCGDRKALAAG